MLLAFVLFCFVLFFAFFCLVGFFCFILFGFVFEDRVSLDQAGLELRNPPASASRVQGLKACGTTPRHVAVLKQFSFYL